MNAYKQTEKEGLSYIMIRDRKILYGGVCKAKNFKYNFKQLSDYIVKGVKTK